ncbi:hypothetical protein PR202_gb09352 [Eleusine coracana subsp. coracana]|uniref:Uncharacterized protein n=1 Tax=Eleusine coracana subsp. coracana TaxID=191504 RepID=A0AAV5EFE5_ELECO|nr:hypothetical protein PR202_gb09352 [Eleusine coracana subsp. coracana]
MTPPRSCSPQARSNTANYRAASSDERKATSSSSLALPWQQGFPGDMTCTLLSGGGRRARAPLLLRLA